MAKAKVVGVRDVNFVSNDGQQIKGTNIYVTRKDENVIGEMSDKIFVRSTLMNLPTFEFGKEYDFIYDGFGRHQALVDIKKVI